MYVRAKGLTFVPLLNSVCHIPTTASAPNLEHGNGEYQQGLFDN
jgi:hypothetical protein